LPAQFIRPGASGIDYHFGLDFGLPLGLELVAKPWAEAKVLQAGQAFEQATEWHTRRPNL
jgi:aspartyl-tRNA(Asn)/glutamyl-tRNA(Gln) amidotransferase subunit A